MEKREGNVKSQFKNFFTFFYCIGFNKWAKKERTAHKIEVQEKCVLEKE